MKGKLYLFFFLASIVVWASMLTFLLSQIPAAATVIAYGKEMKPISHLYTLFGLSLLLILVMFWMSFYPGKMNNPYEVTDDNRVSMHSKMQVFIGVTCLVTTLILMVAAYWGYA